jgi:hypothetical protein
MTTVPTPDLPTETADPAYLTEPQAATAVGGSDELQGVEAHTFENSDQTFYHVDDVEAKRGEIADREPEPVAAPDSVVEPTAAASEPGPRVATSTEAPVES